MTATETHTVVVEREMPYPAEKVWRALTQGPLIKEWLMDNDFQPVAGHKFKFRSPPVQGWDGIIDGVVVVVEPNKTLSYTWTTMGLATVVVFTLAASNGGTKLRMEQSGFRSDHDAAFKGATYGWQRFLGNMERVVAAL